MSQLDLYTQSGNGNNDNEREELGVLEHSITPREDRGHTIKSCFRETLIFEELTAVFHSITEGFFDFVIPESKDERVQERGHH